MKPDFEQPGVQLYCGDCLRVLPTLPDGSVDCVLTDPPYGVMKADWDEDFPTNWIPEAERVSPRMLLMPGNVHLMRAGASCQQYRDCIALYARNGMTRSPIGFGNWIPVLACGDWKWEARPNLIAFTVDTRERIDHPSPKPLRAMRALIKAYTKPGWTILDPFMGSGTIGLACMETGRRFVGVEIDPGYFGVARKRLSECDGPLFAPAQQPMFPDETRLSESTVPPPD